MRKFVFALIASASMVSAPMASPWPGFEAQYSANYVACILPDGTLAKCESAITAHVDALLAADVELDAANDVFSALRKEVFDANAADPEFQKAIDALFELLLPDSGSIGIAAPEGPAATVDDGGDSDPEPGSPQ